jgi:hypothetical protein
MTWLQNQEASGLKQRMIVCVLSLSEWLESNVATGILIRTFIFTTTSKTLPLLRIFVSRNPWYPFAEPSSRNTGIRNCFFTCGMWTTAGISLHFLPTEYRYALSQVYAVSMHSEATHFESHLVPIHTYFLHGAESLFVKLTGSQLVKKLPTFYGPQRFITAFTSARHLPPSWPR